MLRVLVIAGYPDSILQFRGKLLEKLISEGASVKVIAPNLTEALNVANGLKALGIEIEDYPLERNGLNPVRDLISVFWLFWIIKKYRPKIVLAYTIKPIVYGLFAAWCARVELRFALVTGLGYAFSQNVRRVQLVAPWIARRMYCFSLGVASKVFFQNPDDEKLARKTNLLSANVPSCILNGSGVDLGYYRECPIKSQYARFLLVSRLIGDKGIREYARAAEILKNRYSDVEFHLAGWIDSNPTAIKKAELDEWVRKGVVIFHGKLEDVRPVISSSNVYVLPSYYPEGTPRTVLEAMAMGRPIITTDSPGCRETVVDGVNGFLVEIKSVESLVSAMERFILHPELISIMGNESRLIAEEKYDVRKVNAVMLKEMGVQV